MKGFWDWKWKSKVDIDRIYIYINCPTCATLKNEKKVLGPDLISMIVLRQSEFMFYFQIMNAELFSIACQVQLNKVHDEPLVSWILKYVLR